MDSSAAVNIMNIVPVCGVIASVLIDGETVHLMQLLGGAVIIAGVSLGLIDRTPGRSPRPAGQALGVRKETRTVH